MIRITMIGVVLVIGCKADLPVLTDANRGLDARCMGPFADVLVDAFPDSLVNPSASLGAPDTSTVTLTKDSVITVGLIGLGGATDAPGTDLKIHATVEPGGSALVHVAASDMVFDYAATLTETVNEVDIAMADVTSAVYARVIGLAGTIRLDAIEATHNACR